MLGFKEFLLEKLVTFGNKAYPKFGNIVILAGGAGSGKGFVSSNLLGIEGITFDVDKLKEMSQGSTKFAAEVKRQTGIDIKKLNLRKPENVSKLHDILANIFKLPDKNLLTKFRSIVVADPTRKPNLIFDVTLKDIKKLKDIKAYAENLGYNKTDIHLVWIMNSYDVALEQNKKRKRVVLTDILMKTHEGASKTMSDLLKDSVALSTYINGDIWIVFNKVGVDSEIRTSPLGGKYITKTNKFKLKSQGKRPVSFDDISNNIVNKIKEYVPNPKLWEEKKIIL